MAVLHPGTAVLYCTVYSVLYHCTVLQVTPGYRPLYFPPANQSSCPASSGYGGTADGDTGADTGDSCDYGDGGFICFGHIHKLYLTSFMHFHTLLARPGWPAILTTVPTPSLAVAPMKPCWISSRVLPDEHIGDYI